MSKKYEAELAAASPDLEQNLPIAVLLGEATDVAAFVRKYYLPVTKGPGQRPGLSSSKGRVTEDTAAQIDELVQLAAAANSDALLMLGGKAGQELVERTRFVIDEIKAVMEWHLDDGVEDENDAKLAAVKNQHEDAAQTPDALAVQVEDYAALAAPFRKAIDRAIGFEAELLDEAAELAEKLRALPEEDETKAARKAAYDRRNRLINVLYARVRAVRSTARAAFRHHPEIAQGATSKHMRKTRAEARRAQARAKATAPAPTAPATTTPPV